MRRDQRGNNTWCSFRLHEMSRVAKMTTNSFYSTQNTDRFWSVKARAACLAALAALAAADQNVPQPVVVLRPLAR